MKTFYIQAIFAASIGGILYGYDMGVISGALPSLGVYFQMTSTQEEWVVSALYFGGGFGAATGGFLCDLFGRKRSILLTDLVFGIGSFVLYSAQTVSTVMTGRVVVGWAVAVSAIADVAYLHEISSAWEGEGTIINNSEPQIQNGDNHVATNELRRRNSQKSSPSGRGSVVSINEACISLGFLMAYGVAYSVGASDNSEEWRPMFAFGGVLAIVQFLGMLIMPESPIWLHSQGRISEANNSMNKIRGTSLQPSPSFVEVEMHTTTPPPTSQTPAFDPSEFRLSGTSDNASNYAVSVIIHLRNIPYNIKQIYKRIAKKMFIPYKRQCIVSIFLASAQQFCGHPSVLNYSAGIFSILNGIAPDGNIDNSMGTEEQNVELTSVELTVGIGIFKFLTTIAIILFVERIGRRPLLLSGMIVILVSLTFLMFAFSGHGAVSFQQQQEDDSIFTSLRGTLGVIGIYGVAVGYAMSFAPMFWLIISEMFPSSIRGRALGFATVVTYIAAGIVSRTFLSLQNEIGLSKCFSLYGLATFMSILFVWLGIPETGDEKTVEQINREFDSKLIWGGRRATANASSWASLRSYGSDMDGTSPTPSSESIVAETIVTETEPTVLGLSPRRSSSSRL